MAVAVAPLASPSLIAPATAVAADTGSTAPGNTAAPSIAPTSIFNGPTGAALLSQPVNGPVMNPNSQQPVPGGFAPGMGTPVQPAPAYATQRDAIDEAPGAVWYVRPPSGGQFGPAAGDTMRSWVDGGRVTANSLVWRAGWPEWRSAAATFPKLAQAGGAWGAAPPAPAVQGFNGMPAQVGAAVGGGWTGAPVAGAVMSAPVAQVAPVGMAIGAGPGLPVGQVYGDVDDTIAMGVDDADETLSRSRRRRRKSNDMTMVVSSILIGLTVILVVILVIILNRPSSEEVVPVKTPPRAAPAPAEVKPAKPKKPKAAPVKPKEPTPAPEAKMPNDSDVPDDL